MLLVRLGDRKFRLDCRLLDPTALVQSTVSHRDHSAGSWIVRPEAQARPI
jgi:hypothetical protein